MFTGMTSLYTVQLYRLEEQRREAVAKERQDYISPRADMTATLAAAGQSKQRRFGPLTGQCDDAKCTPTQPMLKTQMR